MFSTAPRIKNTNIAKNKTKNTVQTKEEIRNFKKKSINRKDSKKNETKQHMNQLAYYKIISKGKIEGTHNDKILHCSLQQLAPC